MMPRAAYVVDVDEESGKPMRGTRRSAKTSSKEKPKISQRDSGHSDKPKRREAADVDYAAERAVVSSGARKEAVVTTVKEERRKSFSSSTHSPRKEKRPPSSHKNHGLSKLQIPFHSKKEDPTHFGVPTPPSAKHTPAPIVSQTKLTQPIPVRPRPVQAQTYPRPQSFNAAYTSNGGFGPPIAPSAYYQPPPQHMIPPSYPPSPGYMQRISYSVTPAPAPQLDYFGGQYAVSAPDRTMSMSARPLANRFDLPSRTSSASGFHTVNQQEIDDAYTAGYYDDVYTTASDGVARKRESIRIPSRSSSTHRLSKTEADMLAMPPPPRPILRRPLTEYSAESTDGYEARTLIRDDSRTRRPSANRNSVSYDLGAPPVRVETANNGRRRQSYYGQSASTGSAGYEEKYRQAAAYQEDVGEAAPLTAEGLKRHQRRQAGSRGSTKSSASRDESDWRKSATTRTTRSGSDGENVTIKINGTARVSVGGAQIDCPDGGEIVIGNGQKAIRNGSERSSEYGGPPRIDDRRSRDDRTTSGRTRISSRHSYTRQRPKQYYGESRDGSWI